MFRRKYDKVRFSGITVANSYGEKLPIFVISKSKKRKCFSGIGHLPCRF